MTHEYTLKLTEEEALGLLSIAVLSPYELSPEQLSAIEKLTACCRRLAARSDHRSALETQNKLVTA